MILIDLTYGLNIRFGLLLIWIFHGLFGYMYLIYFGYLLGAVMEFPAFTRSSYIQ